MQTVSVRRTVAVPIGDVFDWIADGRNWAKVPGMLYSRVQPADGPEPFGVGSTREFLSTGSKVREVVTAFERPRLISYQTLSTIPPAYHDGGTITFREVTGGTEIAWSTTFQLKSGENAEIAKAKLDALGLTKVELASSNTKYSTVEVPKDWKVVGMEPGAGTVVKSDQSVIVKVVKVQ